MKTKTLLIGFLLSSAVAVRALAFWCSAEDPGTTWTPYGLAVSASFNTFTYHSNDTAFLATYCYWTSQPSITLEDYSSGWDGSGEGVTYSYSLTKTDEYWQDYYMNANSGVATGHLNSSTDDIDSAGTSY